MSVSILRVRNEKSRGHGVPNQYTEYLNLGAEQLFSFQGNLMLILGDGCGFFGFKKLLLKESIQGKACRSTSGYTQVYWQDIPQLPFNYPLQTLAYLAEKK